jgi:hypothetical protein
VTRRSPPRNAARKRRSSERWGASSASCATATGFTYSPTGRDNEPANGSLALLDMTPSGRHRVSTPSQNASRGTPKSAPDLGLFVEADQAWARAAAGPGTTSASASVAGGVRKPFTVM